MTTFEQLVRLRPIEETVFEGIASPDKAQRLFGGQFMAQALAAAQLTMSDDRDVHSLHGYFLRPGDAHEAVRYEVEQVRDGRAFSSRQVSAFQGEREMFRMLASFQTADRSPRYAKFEMPAVPPPEAVDYTYDDFNAEQTGEADWPGSARPIDIRYINPPRERGVAVTESQLMWMRIQDPLPQDPRLQRAALVYLSDATIVDHVMLPHGLRWQDADFEGASLDHAMWFHRPVRADRWLLFEQCPERTGGGRGLGSGRFYDREGNLVATCMQEGLMRWSA